MLRLLLILAVTLTLGPITYYVIQDIEAVAGFSYGRLPRNRNTRFQGDLGIGLLIRYLRILAVASFGVALVMLGIYLSLGRANHLFAAFIAAVAAGLFVVALYLMPDSENDPKADLGSSE